MKTSDLLADGLLTVAETEKLIGIRRSKLYEFMSRGELPYCKFGTARRIPKRAVLDLAARHLVSGEPGDKHGQPT